MEAENTMLPKYKIKVLIADDHLLFTEGLVAMLSEEFEIVGNVTSGREVLPKAHAVRPDILLLDFNLPYKNGLEVAREMRAGMPDVKVIILTMYNEQRFVEMFRKEGVRAYLLKTASKDELKEAIQLVFSGGEYFHTDHRKGAAGEEDFFLKTFSLTQRETEIIRMIKDGLTNKEIAERLCLSAYTVDTHRKNIHLKLRITKVSELVRFAHEYGV